jgi:hypothetical protein
MKPSPGNGKRIRLFLVAHELVKREKCNTEKEKEAPGTPRDGCFVSAWVLAVGINAL